MLTIGQRVTVLDSGKSGVVIAVTSPPPLIYRVEVPGAGVVYRYAHQLRPGNERRE